MLYNSVILLVVSRVCKEEKMDFSTVLILESSTNRAMVGVSE